MENISYEKFYTELNERLKDNNYKVNISLSGIETGAIKPKFSFVQKEFDHITLKNHNNVIHISDIDFFNIKCTATINSEDFVSAWKYDNYYGIRTNNLIIGVELL